MRFSFCYQQQAVLGNKIEMQLTNLIEENPTLLRVGIHFEFNDARNRVSRQLQKNLDTCEYPVCVCVCARICIASKRPLGVDNLYS